MDINDKIRALGERLKDRLDPSLIDFALEYIRGFGEQWNSKRR
ncbi:MafI family immunity protein [Photorhabdus luminescens]|nr:MafI family immunity protein [Photorhabdus luminescens]